jgi:2-iminoacetate synthase
MEFTCEKYKIEDISQKPFIDKDEIQYLLDNTRPDKQAVRQVIAKALSKKRLSLQDTAILVNTSDSELIEEIKQGARTLK